MTTITINTVKEIASNLNINFEDVSKMNSKELSAAHYNAARKSSKKMLVDFYSKMIGLKMINAI